MPIAPLVVVAIGIAIIRRVGISGAIRVWRAVVPKAPAATATITVIIAPASSTVLAATGVTSFGEIFAAAGIAAPRIGLSAGITAPPGIAAPGIGLSARIAA